MKKLFLTILGTACIGLTGCPEKETTGSATPTATPDPLSDVSFDGSTFTPDTGVTDTNITTTQ